MKTIFKLLSALSPFFAFALISCSPVKSVSSGSDARPEVVTALQSDETYVSLINFSRTAKMPYLDISGGTFYLKIMGNKAKAALPRYRDDNAPGVLTVIGAVQYDFDCRRLKSDNRSVTYVLTDVYGNMNHKIKVICYYSGWAKVIVDSNLAHDSVVKFDAELYPLN